MVAPKAPAVSGVHPIVTNIHIQWHDFLVSLAGLPDETRLAEEAVGAWSIKDIMGHITAWEEAYIEATVEYRQGAMPRIFDIDWERDGDAVNARLAEERRPVPLDRTWRNLCESHRKLVQAVNQPEILANRDLVALADEITWKHYRHHAAKIRGFRGEEYPELGVGFFPLKADVLPDVGNPGHWDMIKGSSAYLMVALDAQALEFVANRVYASADDPVAMLLFDLERLTPRRTPEQRRTVTGHTYGWFDREALIDVRKMTRNAQGKWVFPSS